MYFLHDHNTTIKTGKLTLTYYYPLPHTLTQILPVVSKMLFIIKGSSLELYVAFSHGSLVLFKL